MGKSLPISPWVVMLLGTRRAVYLLKDVEFIPSFYIFFSFPKCLSCFETFACVCLKLGLEIQERRKAAKKSETNPMAYGNSSTNRAINLINGCMYYIDYITKTQKKYSWTRYPLILPFYLFHNKLLPVFYINFVEWALGNNDNCRVSIKLRKTFLLNMVWNWFQNLFFPKFFHASCFPLMYLWLEITHQISVTTSYSVIWL